MAIELDYMEYADDPAAQAAYDTNGHHAVTFNVTAQLDTAQKKFGAASLLLDGDSDYLSIGDSVDWDIIGSATDDWTIDFFVKHTDHAGSEYYTGQNEDDSNGWWINHLHGSGLRFAATTGGSVVINTGYGGEISDTNWHHVAMCKVGSDYGMYLDGAQVSHTNDSTTDTYAVGLTIGDYRAGAGALYSGHIDEFRIQHSNVFGAAPNSTPDDTITAPTAPNQIDTNTKLLLHFDGDDAVTATKDWSRLEPVSESTIKQEGSYSLKIFAETDSVNDTLTRTVSPTVDLSGKDTIKFRAYASRTGSQFKIGIHDSGGTTTEYTVNIASANTWQTDSWNISGISDANKDDIDQIIITIVNADSDNTFYLDNMYSELNSVIFFGSNF